MPLVDHAIHDRFVFEEKIPDTLEQQRPHQKRGRRDEIHHVPAKFKEPNNRVINIRHRQLAERLPGFLGMLRDQALCLLFQYMCHGATTLRQYRVQ